MHMSATLYTKTCTYPKHPKQIRVNSFLVKSWLEGHYTDAEMRQASKPWLGYDPLRD